MGMGCRGGGGGGQWQCMCVCLYISVYSREEAKKSLRFSGWVRGRKEGKEELRMAFSRSMLLTAFLYHSTTRPSILFDFFFISLLFIFPQSCKRPRTLWPPTLALLPLPYPQTHANKFPRLSATCFASLSLALLHRLKT